MSQHDIKIQWFWHSNDNLKVSEYNFPNIDFLKHGASAAMRRMDASLPEMWISVAVIHSIEDIHATDLYAALNLANTCDLLDHV